MSSCCAPTTATPKTTFTVTRKDPERDRCPECGGKGKSVDLITVKALLARSLLEIEGQAYRFCPNADCPVVYYGVDVPQVFYEADLRERVFQKHPTDPDVFVCYCFGYRVGDVEAEVKATGTSAAPERITAGVKAQKCACEVRNPQGSCCLGNVRSVIKRVLEEMPAPVQPAR